MYLELKYLSLLSPRLPKFKQVKRNLYNFRCPICGDSKRNKNKARGFAYEYKGDMMYKCHNCGASMTISSFIEKLDPVLYQEYRMEKFSKPPKVKVDMRKVKRVVSTAPVFKSNPLKEAIKIQDLNNSHPAKEYLLRRKLPIEALYYTEKFKEFTNSVKPGTFQDVSHDEERILIPFRTKEGDVFGYQGRSLYNTGLRYITILLEEDHPKIFGLDTLDYDKTIYITEGPLDSLLVENSVAMAGADVSDCRDLGSDYVFVYDNEPGNKEITNRIQSHISKGDSVVIWPKGIKEKDINDMVLEGHPVQEILQSNSYKGLKAQLKFTDWKR